MEFERILSASGPTAGHITTFPKIPLKPKKSKDKALALKRKEPKKIAWFQCVGSRDINKCDKPYCSSVCCMYAIKEAIIAKEHAGDQLECTIFYTDLRTPGKGFERFFRMAKEKYGVRFIRSKVHSVTQDQSSYDLEVRYVDEQGHIVNEEYEMIVLSIGLEIDEDTTSLAERLGIDLTECGFCKTSSFEPVTTSRDGIFVSGAFNKPQDIPDSVLDASGAAAAASQFLSPVRNTLTQTTKNIPQISVEGERPRIGVFICDCGSNIKGVVDCENLTKYAATLPFVEYTEESLYACSQDAQEKMVKTIKKEKLNRIVVAACTPKTHEPLFQETLSNSGLNKYLFEMTNIRNQNSWVHKNEPEVATSKAEDLVRMAVAKAALSEPLKEEKIKFNDSVLVIGGGLAGMTSAKFLASQGYKTHILEKTHKLGGAALKLHKTGLNEHIGYRLNVLIDEVETNDNITVHYNTKIKNIEGFVGNFKATVQKEDKVFEIDHGVAVLATGAVAYQPSEYKYGKDDRIITSLDLVKVFTSNDAKLAKMRCAVFIQCVGSRQDDRPYCSRVCCTHSVINAIELKERNPEMEVFILYREVRTYGERELLYKKARNLGVIFIRYNVNKKPEVILDKEFLRIRLMDHILNMPVEIEADLLILATAVIPRRDDKLAKFYKIPLNDDGFFVEKHAKLGPAEFATEGVFVCGSGHYPRPVNETVTHGQAAASRASTLLAKKDNLFTSGNVACVNNNICSKCGACISICPYSSPEFSKEEHLNGVAQINPVLCKGCGLCVASCRSGAIHLKGFDNNQIFSQIFALTQSA